MKKVKEIRKLLKKGKLQKEIAKNFGVTGATICMINLNRNWKNVM